MPAPKRQLSKKTCLLGDMSVGKTSLVRRFVEDRFDDKYLTTLGVKVTRKVVDISTDGGTIELAMLLWDLAGGVENGVATLAPSYLRGTAGAVLVCDMTRVETLHNLAYYAAQLRAISPDAVLIVAANKADLTEQHQVTADDVTEVAHSLNTVCVVTSAKTGDGVEDLLRALGRRLVPATSKD